MAHSLLILAQAAPGGGSAYSSLFLIVGLFLIMYFVMIRPQQKQMKQQQEMIAALKKGDELVTQGGLLGRVYAVTDKVITLEIANNVRVRVLKSAVQGKLSVSEEEAPAKLEEKKEEK